jgi:hypothetical protein
MLRESVQGAGGFYSQFCTLQIYFDDYNMNREWELISMTSHRNSDKYACCPADTFPSITFEIELQRHSGSYTAIVICPAIGKCSLHRNFVLSWDEYSNMKRFGKFSA